MTRGNRLKCACGRELRSRDEQQTGECRRCQDENMDYPHDLEETFEEENDDE